MLLRLAWRNIWRNKRRTLLTSGAITLGVMALVFLESYRENFWDLMVGELTRAQLGQMQVHGKGYQAEPELGKVVADPDGVEKSLAAALPQARPARRVLGYGLAGTGEQSAAVLVMGIQPDREPSGQGPLTIVAGRDVSEKPAKEAVLGRTLADQLQLTPGPGAELVMVGQAVDGSVANDRFTVVGLADAGNSELDASAVFLNLGDAQDFFGLGQGVHQLLVRMPGREREAELSAQLEALRGALDLSKLEALSWAQMVPELTSMIESKRKSGTSVSLIVFFIVALGVLNTMTMSTFERTREFGVMASLGTRRRRVLGLVITESLLQGLVGLALGAGLAWLLSLAVGSIGTGVLSASGDVMGQRLPAQVSVHLQGKAVVNAAVTVFFTTLVGGLWPAWRASRLKPVEATRYV